MDRCLPYDNVAACVDAGGCYSACASVCVPTVNCGGRSDWICVLADSSDDGVFRWGLISVGSAFAMLALILAVLLAVTIYHRRRQRRMRGAVSVPDAL